MLINILGSKWRDEKAGRSRQRIYSQGKVGSSCLVLWILRRPLTPGSQQRNAGSQREPYQDAVNASEEVSLNNRNRHLMLHDTIFFFCIKGTVSHIKGKVQFVELKKRTKKTIKAKGPERWFSSWEYISLWQRTWVQYPASMLGTTCTCRNPHADTHE